MDPRNKSNKIFFSMNFAVGPSVVALRIRQMEELPSATKLIPKPLSNFEGNHIFDATHGWAVASDKVLKTTDGGGVGNYYLTIGNEWCLTSTLY